MYSYRHKRNVDALLKVGVIIKAVECIERFVVWLQELRWLLTVVVVAGQSVQHLDANAEGL